MGYSQAQKAESRQRVLENASRQIRENGIDALGVADAMRSAGLTHGAFYGHFASRDALIVEALEYALTQSKARMEARKKGGVASLKAIAEGFLDQRHVDDAGGGCALCALAGEARYASPDIRAMLTRYTRDFTARIAESLSGGDEKAALGIVATIVGAVALARAVDDDELAKSILASSFALVMSQDGGGQ